MCRSSSAGNTADLNITVKYMLQVSPSIVFYLCSRCREEGTNIYQSYETLFGKDNLLTAEPNSFLKKDSGFNGSHYYSQRYTDDIEIILVY